MSADFNDQFSAHAKSYADARPDYPFELFLYLGRLCEETELAWDCATGNGQAATSLAKVFKRVIASDASAEQIQQARIADNIEYRQMAAEEHFLQPESVDLVVVAQALHWFDTAAFFENVDRVLTPGGMLAVWSYGLATVSEEVDRVVQKLYGEILDDYWPAERRLVEQQYANIEFPYALIEVEKFEMSQRWNLVQLSDYLMSWSAVRRYMDERGSDPLQLIAQELEQAWGGAPGREMEVQWPLVLKVGRKPGN